MLVIKQMIRFAAVGFSGMLVDFSFTWIIKEKLFMNKFISNSVGFSAAVISNYFLNRAWTFNSNAGIQNEMISFILIAAAGLIINNLCIYLLNSLGKLNFYLGKLVAIMIVFSWNYFMNLNFTFPNAKN